MSWLSKIFAGSAPEGAVEKKCLLKFPPWTYVPPSDYVMLDLETSGLDPCTSEILEIGAIRYRAHTEVSRYHTYVRPTGAISKEASAVNHITWRSVCDAPLLEEVKSDFFDFMQQDVLVGYNVGFDIRFIQTRFETELSNPVFDVMRFVKLVFPEIPRYRLDDLREQFNLGGVSHAALGDCQTTDAILKKCLATDSGQEAAREAAVIEAKQAEEERLRKVATERRAELNAALPPEKELTALSLKMTGNYEDYFDIATKVLLAAGEDISRIQIATTKNYRSMQIDYCQFFGVKLLGKLRYIVLSLPPDNVPCRFLSAPANPVEGSCNSRIYVSAPEELLELKEYILLAYHGAIAHHLAHVSDNPDSIYK